MITRNGISFLYKYSSLRATRKLKTKMKNKNRASHNKYPWAKGVSPIKYVNIRHIMFITVIVYATPDKSTFSDENDIIFFTTLNLKIIK